MVFNYPNACNYRHSTQNIANWILPDNGEIKRPDFSGLLAANSLDPRMPSQYTPNTKKRVLSEPLKVQGFVLHPHGEGPPLSLKGEGRL